MGIVMGRAIFSSSSILITLVFMIVAGLALSSFAVFGAAFFQKAQLSGIVSAIVTIILGIIAQVISASAKTGTVAILSLLFPPMNFIFFLITVARFEQQGLKTNLLHAAPGSTSSLKGIVLWIFFIIQIPGYQMLGALLERYFYGTRSKSRVVSWSDNGGNNSVELSNVSKIYQPNWFYRHIAPVFGRRRETVAAVNDLSLTVVKGQILVLLGANGSGKTTALEAIAGLNKINSGSIMVNGLGGIGICPQKNVLWDELTVKEHVEVFNRLKAIGTADLAPQIISLIKKCDMDRKIKARAKTLSGGQKRKLQLALMLTGGSRVCCIDEVSSGLDPLSRRKIWDILLAERSKITQIFTTHYLDEADLLADHIAILSKGTMRAEGSAVALKAQFGTGYRVAVHHELSSLPAPEFEGISRMISMDRTTYSTHDSVTTAGLIDKLEDAGIQNYQVAGPTIEDVFLQLAEEVAPENKFNIDLNRHRSSASAPIPGNLLDEKNLAEEKVSPMSPPKDAGLALLTGRRIGFLRQAWVLYLKRLTIIRRNYLPFIAAFCIPIVAAGLVTIFLSGYSLGSCVPGDSSNTPTIHSLAGQQNLDILLGPQNQFTTQDLATLSRLVGGRSNHNTSSLLASVNFVDTLQEFNDYVNANFSNLTPGGLFLGNDSQPPLFAYIGNGGLYYSCLVQNALDSLLTNISIGTQYSPFAIPLSVSSIESYLSSEYSDFVLIFRTASHWKLTSTDHISRPGYGGLASFLLIVSDLGTLA